MMKGVGEYDLLMFWMVKLFTLILHYWTIVIIYALILPGTKTFVTLCYSSYSSSLLGILFMS